LDTSTRTKDIKIPFLKEGITVTEYLALAHKASHQSEKELKKILDEFRRDFRDIQEGKFKPRAPMALDILALGIDVCELQIELIEKLLWMHHVIMWLYVDIRERLSQYPTKKQVKRADKVQKLAIAKKLLRALQYKPVSKTISTRKQSPLYS